MSFIRRLFWLAIVFLMISCASLSPDEGIGGTGMVVKNIGQQSGLGGTGRSPGGLGGTGRFANVENGLGGTGAVALGGDGIGGTGIVGTITAFGSIWVNKAHVTFDDETPISINLLPATKQDLKIGQVVAVLSDHHSGLFAARSIDVVHEIIAPVTAKTSHSITLLNHTVSVSNTTLINRQGEIITLNDVDVGEWLLVSGLRRKNGGIVASRLDVTLARDTIQIIGQPTYVDDGVYDLNGLRLHIESWLMDEYESGRLLITGQVKNGEVNVVAIGEDSITRVIEQSESLLMEVFIDEFDNDTVIHGVTFRTSDSLSDDEFVASEFIDQTDDDDPVARGVSEEEDFDEEDFDEEDFDEEDFDEEDFDEEDFDEEDFDEEDFDEEDFDEEDFDEEDFDEEDFDEEDFDEEGESEEEI